MRAWPRLCVGETHAVSVARAMAARSRRMAGAGKGPRPRGGAVCGGGGEAGGGGIGVGAGWAFIGLIDGRKSGSQYAAIQARGKRIWRRQKMNGRKRREEFLSVQS